MVSRIVESDELTMTTLVFDPWRPLLDYDDRTVGWAREGRVLDGDDMLVVRGLVRGGLYSVVAGDGSLVGTMVRVHSDDGLWAWDVRLGDSQHPVARYSHHTVRLPGAEGPEVATIVRFRRFLRPSDWQLTFSSCEDPQLRLMSLWLLSRLARTSNGGS